MSASKLAIRHSSSPGSSPRQATHPRGLKAQDGHSNSPLETRFDALESRTRRIEQNLDRIYQQLEETDQRHCAERENSKIRSISQQIIWMPVYNAEGSIVQPDHHLKDMPALRFYKLQNHRKIWLLLDALCSKLTDSYR